MTVLDRRPPLEPRATEHNVTRQFGQFIGLGIALLAASSLPGPLRFVSLPLVLVVPGYVVCTATIGSRRPSTWPTRLALWMAMSLAVPAVVGLAVGLPRREFDRVTALVAQGMVVLAAAAWIAMRPEADGDTWRAGRHEASVRPTLVAAGLAALVSVGILGIYVQVNRPALQFTTARIDGVEPEAPLAFPSDGVARLPVVLTNETGRTVAFRLDAGIDGVTDRWDSVEATVEPGARWVGEVRGPVPTSGCLQRVSVQVFESGAPSETGPLSRWIAPKPGVLCVRHPTTTTPGS